MVRHSLWSTASLLALRAIGPLLPTLLARGTEYGTDREGQRVDAASRADGVSRWSTAVAHASWFSRSGMCRLFRLAFGQLRAAPALHARV